MNKISIKNKKFQVFNTSDQRNKNQASDLQNLSLKILISKFQLKKIVNQLQQDNSMKQLNNLSLSLIKTREITK